MIGRLALASLAAVTATLAAASPMTPARTASIDAAARAAMETTGAKGFALAVIEGGKPVLVRAYGARNAGGDPLRTDTVMYGASITKALFAYTVMELVDAKKVDLDRPVAAMLPKPLPAYGNLDAYGNWGDLAGDERWRAITPRHILTHSTGFANFAFLEPGGKLGVHFDPGSRYSYSGEGIILLQFALEQGLGIEVGQRAQRVFDRLGMTRTSLVWRPDFAGNLADGWTADGKAEPHDERSRVRAAGSMDTTIADLAKFAAALVSGDGLSKAAHAEMLRPQLPILSASQFPTLQDDASTDKRTPHLSAGLGVVTFTGPQGPGFFKGGHNDTTGNMLVCIERGRRCVLILANDVRAEKGFPDLVRAMLGETGMPWRWEYGAP